MDRGAWWAAVYGVTQSRTRLIQLVHRKGNQSWIFIGRTDPEAETPILWPPDVKNWFIGKDPDARKDWRQEEKGTTEDEMVRWHLQLNGHDFEKALGYILIKYGQSSFKSSIFSFIRNVSSYTAFCATQIGFEFLLFLFKNIGKQYISFLPPFLFCPGFPFIWLEWKSFQS